MIQPVYNDNLNADSPMVSGVAVNWDMGSDTLIQQAQDLSIQINTTKRSAGPFSATFKLLASNDGGDNYVPVSGYTTHTIDSQSFLWRVADPDFIEARVSYANVAGSGLVEVWPAVKS